MFFQKQKALALKNLASLALSRPQVARVMKDDLKRSSSIHLVLVSSLFFFFLLPSKCIALFTISLFALCNQ